MARRFDRKIFSLQIKTYRNAPILNSSFESSIPGLYFTGFSAVMSFGPLYRFIHGTDAAAYSAVEKAMH